ncbi:SulA-like leucine-rich domain-containing protein [Flocculibacter collagenilyticus]|uniref:SulA-like leucine-rich domain-containing protein n=1 Tax=Flocculibacter collagenilyticus TaxID=2744479 RepID=UPI0018F51718|nr:SulA-like leucine-rich domain-containing protein [Flocculibacter collagenilyticus]
MNVVEHNNNNNCNINCENNQHSLSNGIATNNVVQLIKVEDELSATFELIKIVKKHAHSKKWTLLIAPEHVPSKQLLNSCSVNFEHVLVIHEKQITNKLDVIRNALKYGTCSAVVTWMDVFTTDMLNELNHLTNASSCAFYALNKQTVPISNGPIHTHTVTNSHSIAQTC